MDDVVADWQGHVEQMLDYKFAKDERLPDGKWRRLKDNQRLYSELPVRKGAVELVNWVTDYADATGSQVFFLSAIPKGNDMPWAPQDKVFWGQEYFPDIPVFLGPYAHQKYMHVRNPGDILIDDRRSNCEEWERAGGRAHIYKDWFVCKKWLEDTLLNGKQLYNPS
jgi:5'(3')-deoxyribonucleotidase